MVLLDQIDNILMEICEHEWINDTLDGPFNSRDICWCKKCYIRK